MPGKENIVKDMINKTNSTYQWPANKIGPADMAILYQWRKKTNTPINQLLVQAVQEVDKIIRRR